MARSPETTPHNRLKDTVPASLQKFLPLIATTGDGLVVAAWLNAMGVSAETLLNSGKLPNMDASSMGKRMKELVHEKDIADVVVESNLSLETCSEMLELLTTKRIRDAQSEEEKKAIEQEGKRRTQRIHGAMQAFRDNKEAVKFAAEATLNGVTVPNITSVLSSRFGLHTYQKLLSNAFGSLKGLVREGYPHLSEKDIDRRMDEIRSSAGESGAKLYIASEKQRLLRIEAVNPSLEAVHAFSKILQSCIAQNRGKEKVVTRVNDFVRITQRVNQNDGFPTISVQVSSNDEREQALGWFSHLSENLKTWADTKGDTDSSFDPLVLFNEKTQPFKRLVQLVGNRDIASAWYQTGIGFVDSRKKK